jgi:hypothetical protein
VVVADNTSSAAGAITFAFLGIGVFSLFVLTPWGRKRALPLVALLLGLVVLIGALWDLIRGGGVTVIFLMGLLVGGFLTIGGFGAMGAGTEVPHVEGIEPSIDSRPPRHLPDELEPPPPDR